MVKTLLASEADFSAQLKEHLKASDALDSGVSTAVREIVLAVRERGDDAVKEYSALYDQLEVKSVSELRVSKEAIEDAYAACSDELLDALKLAKKRVEAYHKKQLPKDERWEDTAGISLGWQWKPLQRVGLYVPGGTAAYPSSVIMNAIPAIVAGVESITMVVPAPKGELNPAVLAAAKIAGIEDIYTIGGAQAIAALAYGTETIDPVDTIVGPGNAYVAAAKRMVYGRVGIDTIAGPSEILVIADDTANARWIAADLLSQAEHDTAARCVLITDSESLAADVVLEVDNLLPTLSREEIARQSWEENALIIIADGEAATIHAANLVAAEHVELCVKNAKSLAKKITNAGALFIGNYTCEALGDYLAGPSHVLPTSGAARFSSGLSVYDFLTRSSIIEASEKGFNTLADATAALADQEGLDAHALSVRIRKGDNR